MWQHSVGEQPGKEVETVTDKTHESPKKPDTVKGKPTPVDNTPYFGLTSALQCQFKIIGQNGEPNQKDKVSYTSLVRQIEASVDQLRIHGTGSTRWCHSSNKSRYGFVKLP